MKARPPMIPNRNPMVSIPFIRRLARAYRHFVPLWLVQVLMACGDSTGPANTRVSVAVAAGDLQFVLPGGFTAEPLFVAAIDPVSRRSIEGVRIRWSVLQGAGAQVVPLADNTDALGLAGADLRAGADTGEVRVEARADGMVGVPATFRVRVVRQPVIAGITPDVVAGGSELTITGQNFRPVASDNTVLFDGRPGFVLSASTTTLRVIAPVCTPTRTTNVRVQLGAVASAPHALETVASAAAVMPLQLTRGQAITLSDAADFACLHLPSAPVGAAYLLTASNARPAPGLGMPFELIGLGGDGPIVAAPRVTSHRNAASDWEIGLRIREREFRPGPGAPLRSQAEAQEPSVGDISQFNVLNRDGDADRITAEIRAISQRAILFVDVQAPAAGFTAADLNQFGALFDDPIHPTDVAAFGSPSDIDGNNRIIILFTPRVNALTEPSDNSFIAGFFYGCDLVVAQVCPETNRAEIFYAMVPDPSGLFGSPRSKQTVLRTVPAVLAHEFQHMIHFGQKGRLDLLWLSEGLAHAAEDLVGGVFAARGDNTNANDFRQPNYSRASSYLSAVDFTSLVSEESPGTLELRGGAWLLMKYLAAHYGGTSLLGALTRSQRLGTENITAETARSWPDLFTEFAVALWASDAPELLGAPLDSRYTFPDIDLRAELSPVQGFPLSPFFTQFRDFTRTGELPPGAMTHAIVEVQSGDVPPLYNISFAGRRGGPLAGTPRFSILRIR